MSNLEPLILAIDLGMTTGLAVGRRARMHKNNSYRFDLYWDYAVRKDELYGALEQVSAEYDVQIVIVELPVLSVTNPFYNDLKSLVSGAYEGLRQIFGCPIVEVKPGQWKTTPAIRFTPADNVDRTAHQWDALRIAFWFAKFGINEREGIDIFQRT